MLNKFQLLHHMLFNFLLDFEELALWHIEEYGKKCPVSVLQALLFKSVRDVLRLVQVIEKLIAQVLCFELAVLLVQEGARKRYDEVLDVEDVFGVGKGKVVLIALENADQLSLAGLHLLGLCLLSAQLEETN